MKVKSLAEARKTAAERGMAVIEHVSHPRGTRINVVLPNGRPKTLTIQNKRCPECGRTAAEHEAMSPQSCPGPPRGWAALPGV